MEWGKSLRSPAHPSPMSPGAQGTRCSREGLSSLLLLVHSLLEEGSGLKTQQGSPQTRLAVPVAGACGLHTRAEDGEVPGATQPETVEEQGARQGPETAWGSTASSKQGIRPELFSCQRGCVAPSVERSALAHGVWTPKLDSGCSSSGSTLSSGSVSGALWSSEKGPGLQNAWGGCGERTPQVTSTETAFQGQECIRAFTLSRH